MTCPCCSPCSGPCDSENPCPEGCVCCDGQCVSCSDYTGCDVYVNGVLYPIENEEVQYPCWLPETPPEWLNEAFDGDLANLGSAWITGVVVSGCEITINWTSLVCRNGEDGPIALQPSTQYETKWKPCGINAETGRGILTWVSTTVTSWSYEDAGEEFETPPVPDFTGETIEMDCNPLP